MNAETIPSKLLIKGKPQMLICYILFALIGLGGLSGYIMADGFLIEGCIGFAIMLLLIVGVILDHYNSYILITAESVTSCNLFKQKNCFLWKKCTDVYLYKRRIFTHVVIEYSVASDAVGVVKPVTQKTFLLPWSSTLTAEEKEMFLAILKSSPVPSHLKTLKCKKLMEIVNDVDLQK